MRLTLTLGHVIKASVTHTQKENDYKTPFLPCRVKASGSATTLEVTPCRHRLQQALLCFDVVRFCNEHSIKM